MRDDSEVRVAWAAWQSISAPSNDPSPYNIYSLLPTFSGVTWPDRQLNRRKMCTTNWSIMKFHKFQVWYHYDCVALGHLIFVSIGQNDQIYIILVGYTRKYKEGSYFRTFDVNMALPYTFPY